MLELDDTASWAGVTEEFLAQIHRSSDLLSQDRQDEARQLLEAAFESRADDASGQATLALVYFKLSRTIWHIETNAHGVENSACTFPM